MKRVLWSLLLVSASTALHAAPDEELLGKSRGYPIGNRSNWFYDETVRVGSFSNVDRIWPHHVLPRAPSASALKRAATEPELRYTFNGQRYSIDDYLDHQRATGLLIIKDGEILVERYQYDRKPTDKLLSNSIAKSLVSLAVGFALQDRRIESLDDRADRYVADLKGYAYGETRLRNLLRMASGVRFSEEYDGHDDLAKFGSHLNRSGTLAAVKAFNDRQTNQGERFKYASIETHVLALVLRAATGRSLADYLSEKLWTPMGAESDATWAIAPDDRERAGGNFSATLRDWGRLGILLANDGALNDRQIIPRDYLLEATDWRRHPPAFSPFAATRRNGYGYHFWIFPGEHRRFALLGVFGQAIFVDPELKLVLVHTAAARSARIGTETMGAELNALWTALVNQYGKW